MFVAWRSTVDDFVLGMAGAGGDGVVGAGESLIAAAAFEGYHAMMTKSFGSQVRGGESSCRVRVSTRPVHNPGGALTFAVALNWDDFQKLGAELPLSPDTLLAYDAKAGVAPASLAAPRQRVSVPISELARAATGAEKAKTSVVLGLLSGWFGFAAESLLRALRKRLAKRGEEAILANLRAFELGAAFAREHAIEPARRLESPRARVPKLLTDGNDMCAAAAIFAGCEFFAGYPITPSTEIMQLLGRELWKYGGTVLQAEDEIAGIGAALGASFAGKKAMTATSGPGMALKSEILGLASMAELPLVIVNVQRGGPSTGLPTKAEQSDLFQAVFSASGDVLRPVLAPSSVADTAAVTVEAFNLAELYQTPVILLSDQEIAQRKETVDLLDTSRFVVASRRRPTEEDLRDYARFRATEDGVSPLSHPGMLGGSYQGAGIEHNERGNPTASGAVHAAMNEKRFAKLAPLRARRDLFAIEGDANAPLALVSWGSLAGVCREALRLALAEGLAVKLVVPWLLYPVSEEVYREAFASVRAGLVVEASHQGQLFRLLRMFVEVPPGVVSFCRSGATPIQPGEVLTRLRALAAPEPPAARAPQEVQP